jgi:lysophospholipase L1-like esterase
MGQALRVCFLGDSFVHGTGDPACLGWAGRVCASAIARSHDVTWYNLGVRRATSADVRTRWRAEVEPRLPRELAGAVVFSFGVNDTTLERGAPRVAPGETIENALAVLREAGALWPASFVGPPPIDDDDQNARIASTDHALARAAASVGVPYLSVFEPLACTPAWRSEVRGNDGAHPRAGGYEALAHLVERWPAWRALLGE